MTPAAPPGNSVPPPDPQALARLHARCFTTPRPWGAEEFAGMLAQPGVFAVTVAQGFALGRVVAGEAELLTLAVAPEARRRGVGRRLVQGFLAQAAQGCAQEAFLEVAADNRAALALYAAAGFIEVGRRLGYLAGPGTAPVDALVLRHSLIA